MDRLNWRGPGGKGALTLVCFSVLLELSYFFGKIIWMFNLKKALDISIAGYSSRLAPVAGFLYFEKEGRDGEINLIGYYLVV